MTTTKRTDCWRSAGFALLAAALLLWPAAALALPTCTTSIADLCLTANADGDCDGDGFTNAQECGGFYTPTSKFVAGYNSTDAAGAAIPAADKLDPSKPDLFYMVTDMNGLELQPGSLLLAALGNDPNSALKVYANGLKVNTHRITSADCGPDRLLVGTIRAAKIRENLSTTAEGTYLGSTPQSKPNDALVASTIYTQKIKNNVTTNCPAGTSCSVKGTLPLVTNAAGNDAIVNYYILQVVSHEMGHGSRLANTTAASYYHYSKSGTIMDPAASFSRGVYTIPTQYDATKDPVALTLK